MLVDIHSSIADEQIDLLLEFVASGHVRTPSPQCHSCVSHDNTDMESRGQNTMGVVGKKWGNGADPGKVGESSSIH